MSRGATQRGGFYRGLFSVLLSSRSITHLRSPSCERGDPDYAAARRRKHTLLHVVLLWESPLRGIFVASSGQEDTRTARKLTRG